MSTETNQEEQASRETATPGEVIKVEVGAAEVARVEAGKNSKKPPPERELPPGPGSGGALIGDGSGVTSNPAAA